VGGRFSGFKGFAKIVGGGCCDTSRDVDANDDDGTGDRGLLAFAGRESCEGIGDGRESSSHSWSESQPDCGANMARGDTVACTSKSELEAGRTGVSKGLPWSALSPPCNKGASGNLSGLEYEGDEPLAGDSRSQESSLQGDGGRIRPLDLVEVGPVRRD